MLQRKVPSIPFRAIPARAVPTAAYYATDLAPDFASRNEGTLSLQLHRHRASSLLHLLLIDNG